ncbi:hypothetical protein BASA81_005632 [Batrachochytrium salamandrivorans]|nr:hypothetical protein BASA81_005632 [Batrachochytrium salamandrivorans]
MRITDFFRPVAAAAPTAATAAVDGEQPPKRQRTGELCPCFLNHSYRCCKHSVFRTLVNRQLDPRQIHNPNNLTWQWMALRQLSKEQILQLDCGVLPTTHQPKRILTAMEFSPETGELLLVGNMDRVSLFSFDHYRTVASKPNDHQLDVEPEMEYEVAPGGLVDVVGWNPWNGNEFYLTLPSTKQVKITDIETGMDKAKLTIAGVPTCMQFMDHNVVVVGTSTGALRGFDLRRKDQRIFTFEQPGKHPVVAVLSQPGNKFIGAFGNGEIGEFHGYRQSQGAIAMGLPVLNQTRRELSRVGISAMVGPTHTRHEDMAVMCVDGSIQRFNPLRFGFSTHAIKQPGNWPQDVQYYNPQPSSMGRGNEQHLTNFKACIEFAPQSRHLFSLRRFEENIVDVFDLRATARRKLGPPSPSLEANDYVIKTFEFKRNVSALAVHPDSDVVVCALQKSSLLQVRGLL